MSILELDTMRRRGPAPTWRVIPGDCVAALDAMAPASVDAVVTDPPYGIAFMGRHWDRFDGAAGPARFQAFAEAWARAALRVLKPGGYVVAFGATRNYHRLACGIEDAGFEVRDCCAWLFGSGFPKSLNLGDGTGTALKPGYEPIIIARAPFAGTVAACHAAHGTAALNIDACRIPGVKPVVVPIESIRRTDLIFKTKSGTGTGELTDVGRWPANVLLDEAAAAMLDAASGDLGSCDWTGTRDPDGAGRRAYGAFQGGGQRPAYGDTGGASRFFYVAKPSRDERDIGTAHLPRVTAAEVTGRAEGSAGIKHGRAGVHSGVYGNAHPTVKPIALMRWLVRLVTPPGGVVLDPFTGSGTTGIAARLESRSFIGVEREAAYVTLAEARIAGVAPLFDDAADTPAAGVEVEPPLPFEDP